MVITYENQSHISYEWNHRDWLAARDAIVLTYFRTYKLGWMKLYEYWGIRFTTVAPTNRC